MFKKIVAICLTAFLYVAVSAQNFWDEFRTKSLDVEGVKIGQKMTYGQFVAKFGKPTEYTQSDSDSGEDGTPTIDDIIIPDATRKRLIMAYEMLYGKKQRNEDKKHTTI